MVPSFLVLADLSAVSERAARCAAVLGTPLGTHLNVLHFYHDPVLELELAAVTLAQLDRNQADVTAALREMARHLPAPADVTVSVEPMPAAVEEAVRRQQPLLLAMGLSTEHNLLDWLLHNQVLPILRATHWPLLLVPEAAPTCSQVPRRVLLALDAEPFTPSAAARRLVPLLRAWKSAYTVAYITACDDDESERISRLPLADMRASALLPPDAPLLRYQEANSSPAAGILQALDDTQADLLVLIARPRSFLARRFHSSVTAQVLRDSRVPVLLLPADAPVMPG